jgi:hypothetical protein
MSRQAAEVGLPESEYLTVPEIARILRRNRKTIYGWIEIPWNRGSGRSFRRARTLLDPLADVPIEAVQTPRETTRSTAGILGGIENGMAGNRQTRPPENRL